LRRIADFWQEGEYRIAKSQIEEFITIYPESPYSDTLCAALADLFLREQSYEDALHYYSLIQSSELTDQIFLNKLQCLYEMQWFASLAQECETFLEEKSDLKVTYFLSIALYHQCLNASNNPELERELAERAKPHFDILSESPLSDDLAEGYAHLCHVLKESPKAAQIYRNLAKKSPESHEDMLFQAALIESEYDKLSAIKSFEDIAKLEGKKSQEALYNQFVLLFELAEYEKVSKMAIDQFPSSKVEAAHLFLGQSLLHLKKYDEAIYELKTYLKMSPASDTLRATLLTLIEASYQCNDINAMDESIEKLASLNPQDVEIPKAYFTRAQVLKKLERIPEARLQLEQILSQFPEFGQNSQAIFELLHLDYHEGLWGSCNSRARSLIQGTPNHELAPFAWRYLISSDAELAMSDPHFNGQLTTDLEAITNPDLAGMFSSSELEQWQFLHAKTNFEMGHFDKAIKTLQNLSSPNGELLLALCYKEGAKDLPLFCEIAEKALLRGANLIEEATIHTALFNAYLTLNSKEKAAEHLYIAFEKKGDIQEQNLFFLAELFYHKAKEGAPTFSEKAVNLLERLKGKDEEHLCFQLADLYAIRDEKSKTIELLSALENPSDEALLLLAKCYAENSELEKASTLFDQILKSSRSLRSLPAATACLEGARLKEKLPNIDREEIALQLKNLIIQKTIVNEPIHLEAALDYVEWMAPSDLDKKLSLLEKIKTDFESQDDLLSKDYHLARANFPDKDQIYQEYMQFIDAEIALLKGQNSINLTPDAKEILVKIVEESTTAPLLERARMLLADFE